MPDTPAVALRLHGFIEAAAKKASTSDVQPEYRQYSQPAPPKQPILRVYEEYVRGLTDEERAKLYEIIGKMAGAV